LGGVLLFWVGVFLAGALVDGYSAREDYISSLASRGSPVALLGVGALLASAAAHLVTAWVTLKAWRSWFVSGSLLLSGVGTGVVAVFGSSCPAGPPGCAVSETSSGDWVDTVHGVSAGVYELFALSAMLTLAVGALRPNTKWPRWLGAASLLFAVASLLLIGQTDGGDIGLWQRLWLANNLAWLLTVAWVGTGEFGYLPRSGSSSESQRSNSPG